MDFRCRPDINNAETIVCLPPGDARKGKGGKLLPLDTSGYTPFLCTASFSLQGAPDASCCITMSQVELLAWLQILMIFPTHPPKGERSTHSWIVTITSFNYHFLFF